jgi:phosphosulfolactate phosphohydrolase-like enzyme
VIHGASYKIGVGASFLDEIQTDETVVIIDNLRASSTIVTALWLGVEEIVPVLDDKDAAALQQQGTLTAGESGGMKISGYDIGNSPVELAETFKQSPFSRLVLKTSNLIPLLVRLRQALICSSLNLSAMAGHLRGKAAAIIAVGGPWGEAEDLGVALALAGLASGAVLDTRVLSCFVRESRAAQHLQQIGYGQDVSFISRTGLCDVLPFYDGRTIRRIAGNL